MKDLTVTLSLDEYLRVMGTLGICVQAFESQAEVESEKAKKETWMQIIRLVNRTADLLQEKAHPPAYTGSHG